MISRHDYHLPDTKRAKIEDLIKFQHDNNKFDYIRTFEENDNIEMCFIDKSLSHIDLKVIDNFVINNVGAKLRDFSFSSENYDPELAFNEEVKKVTLYLTNVTFIDVKILFISTVNNYSSIFMFLQSQIYKHDSECVVNFREQSTLTMRFSYCDALAPNQKFKIFSKDHLDR